MDSGPRQGTIAGQAKLAAKPSKDALHGAARQRVTVVAYEECRTESCIGGFIALRGVTAQGLRYGGMHRHQPRLAELGLPDTQDAGVKVNIVTLQSKSFGEAKARAGQQPQ